MSGAEQCPHEIRIRSGTATSYGPRTGDGTKENSLQNSYGTWWSLISATYLKGVATTLSLATAIFGGTAPYLNAWLGEQGHPQCVPVLPAGYGNFVRSDWTAHVGNQGHRAVERCVKRRPLQTPGTGHALGRFLGFERTHERSRTKVSHPRQIALRFPPHTL